MFIRFWRVKNFAFFGLVVIMLVVLVVGSVIVYVSPQRPEVDPSPPVQEERGPACERHQRQEAITAQRIAAKVPGRAMLSTRPRLVPHPSWMMSVGNWSERPEIQAAPEAQEEPEKGPECPRHQKHQAARAALLGE